MSAHRWTSWIVGGLALAAVAPTTARAEGFGIGVEGGYYDMTNAKNSAKAVFDGKSGGATFGGFVRRGLGRSFFVGVGGRVFSRTGERAFAADKNSPAYSLGFPLKVRVLPIYALFGYRFTHDSRLTPYAGLGVGFTSYREESTVAGEVFKQSDSKASGHVALGVEYGRGSLRVAVEGMYMTAPDTIGQAGISKVYEEKDVGGLSVVGRVVFVP